MLKLKLDVNLLEHLQQMERDPDSTFVELLMKLQQNTESHEHLCICWTICPNGNYERFRSHETNPNKAYQEYFFLEKNVLEQLKKQLVFVIFLACNKYIFTKYIFVWLRYHLF